MFSRLFLIILVALTCEVSNAQVQQLFQKSNHLDYTLQQGADKPGNTDILRVVRLIAQGDGRQASSVQFTITLDQTLRIIRENTKSLLVQLEHNNVQLKNSVQVRGFDISPQLLPNSIELNYSLLRPGTLPAEYKANRRVNGSVVDRVEVHIADSTSGSGCKVEVSQLYFLYTENTIRKLEDRINLIKEYYSHEFLLNQAYDRLIRINPQDVISLDMQNANLLEIEKFISDTKARHFDTELELAVYDPVELRKKLSRLEDEAIAKRSVMNQTKANLYLYFYNSGLDFKSRGRYQQAYDAFMISIRENPLFAPSLYQLALMDFEEGRLGESECRSRTILEDLRPDPDIERMTRSHLMRLSKTYVDLGEERLSQSRIDDALDLFKRGYNLCTTLPGIECDERLNGDLLKAHSAKYKQLLDQSRQAYQRNDLDGAERDIDNAVAYQYANRRFITSPAEALEMRKAVKQKRYDRMMEEAGRLHADGNDGSCIEKLMQANALLNKEGLAVNPQFATLLRSSGKPVFLQRVAVAKQSVKDNKLNQARSQVNDLVALQKTYMLEQDADCSTALNEVRNMIFSQECSNAQQQLDDFAAKAGLAFDKRDYIATEDFIYQALKISDNNKDCRLGEGNLRATVDSIRQAVAYQRKIAEVLRLQSGGRLSDAFELYNQAAAFFSSNGLERFQLKHEAIDSFAYSRCSVEFLNYLANIYIDRQEYDHSLELFKNVLTRNGGKSTSAMNKSLVRLGIELAVRDKRNGSAESWKSGALRYTHGDKRLKALEKGYKEGWKKG